MPLPAELVARAGAAGLTEKIPEGVARECDRLTGIASSREDVRPVVCPPLVPEGPARHVRAGLRPGPSRDVPRAVGWAIEAMSPSIGPAAETHGGHWRIESNSRAGHRHLGFRPTAAAIAGKTGLAGVPVRVYEMPPYPLGGVDGGHVVVEWSQAGTVLHASVHGHRNRALARLMAAGLIQRLRAAAKG